jgi:hypothetical protein
MSKLILVIIFVLAFGSSVYGQWVEQTNPTGKKVHGISFPVNGIPSGYICGDTGTVMLTVNSGVNWLNAGTGIPASINMTDIHFISQTTGFCSGGLGSLSGNVFKTPDGGTWTQIFDTTGIGIRSVYFISSLTGWAVGNGGTVKYTSNAGASWLTRSFNGTTNTCVFAFSADTVFVSGFGSAGYIVKSVNGGVNWSFSTVPANLADIRFIHFVDSYTGYAGGLALGGLGGMCKTTDRGLTWTLLAGYTGTTPTDAKFVNANTGFAVNSTELKLTTDGGLTWNNQVIPAGGLFEKIALRGSFGIVAGKKIATLTTIGIEQISSEIPNKYSLEQNHPNPFNPVTNISFNIPKAGNIKLIIFDMLGKQISTPVDQDLGPGIYNVDFNAPALSSGIYFYSLLADGVTIGTKKMTLIK